MSSQLPPMPDLIHDEWDKYSLEDLREEMANNRRFVASLFLQVKEWTTRMNDLAQTSEQQIKLHSELTTQLSQHDEDIRLIASHLGLTEDEQPYDDTPQPNNNLSGNPYK